MIVAHSIGGLLAEQIVLEQRPELKNIGLLVEMGTPHLGPYKYTALGRHSRPARRQAGRRTAGGIALSREAAGGLGRSSRTGRTRFVEGSPNDDVVSLESAQAGCDEKHAYPSLDHRGLVKADGHARRPLQDTDGRGEEVPSVRFLRWKRLINLAREDEEIERIARRADGEQECPGVSFWHIDPYWLTGVEL